MSVLKVGQAPDGSDLMQIKIARDGLSATLLSFGATLQDLRLQGISHSLVLGYEDPNAYLQNPNYFGAIVGRYANRIANGRAKIDGQTYQFDQNTEHGHTIHGGAIGASHMNWTVAQYSDDHVAFKLRMADGHMGFPGNLDVVATYRILDNGVLDLCIEAETDQTTLCSFAHHSYFNLSGEKTVDQHKLKLNANKYLPVDKAGIPSGEIAFVENTRFDVRHGVYLQEIGAIDHNFCFDIGDGKLKEMARLSGGDLELRLSSTAEGLQVYTGDGINDTTYTARGGIALEPQIWPDAPNHEGFPEGVLAGGCHYTQQTRWRFCLK